MYGTYHFMVRYKDGNDFYYPISTTESEFRCWGRIVRQFAFIYLPFIEASVNVRSIEQLIEDMGVAIAYFDQHAEFECNPVRNRLPGFIAFLEDLLENWDNIEFYQFYPAR